MPEEQPVIRIDFSVIATFAVRTPDLQSHAVNAAELPRMDCRGIVAATCLLRANRVTELLIFKPLEQQIMRKMFYSFALLLVSSGLAGAATEPTPLGAFADWQAFTYRTKTAPVCYIIAKPTDSESTRNSKRDDVYFMVTHWPGRKVFGEVSTIIGYPFKEGSQAKLQVGDETYELPTDGDSAWVKLPRDEAQVIAALKDGRTLKIKGTSERGTQTVDTYSLSGFSAAFDRINEACK
jgi:hypothetical protein